LHAEISASGAQLEIDELPTVYGHALQLRMLFQNLLSNAIKFRHEDRTPQVSIRHQKPSHPDYHFITVTDNGIGINAEHHEKVFKLFQRLHTHDTYPGSGLGLTLCQRIVTNHAGMLTLKSELGVGSTFEISLKRSLNDN
jgi:light-regulated signal transduction histidine kinase (bacteriophytochrome)